MNPHSKKPTTNLAIKQWLEQLKANNLALDTQLAYARDIEHLTRLYPLDSASAFQQNHLLFALSQLHAEGIQPRSLARMLSAWRNFFNWYSEQYQTGHNPTLGIQPPYGNYPDPKILSIEQTEQLLNIDIDPNDPVALRDQAIFELLYSSGLRLAEIIALDIQAVINDDYQSKGWIDLHENEVQIHSKEQRQRNVPIGQPAINAIKAWLAIRPDLLKTDSLSDPTLDSTVALFLGVRGQRISPRVIQKQLQLRAQQVGLSQTVFPHRLRNSFANHLLESSQDLSGVQQLLGHANISSTQSLSQLNPEQLAQFMQAHPHHNKKAQKPDQGS